MKNRIKNNKWIFITFIVSLVVISVIYILNKVSPFGNNSLLTVDFYHQYGPMLNELTDRIKSGETFLYSLNTGGGIPFYRNFLNYLSSPFNIILLFMSKKSIVTGYSIIIGLKAIFAATFMSYFLKNAFKKDGPLLTVFGILYSFSGYFCAYYWNIMWLDGMVFLPLIILGITKLVDEKRPLLYMCSLSVMLFANYFIGYMICIYSVLFFIGYFIYKRNFKFKNIIITGLLFTLFSILAAGLCAFALIPLYKSLATISATKDSFPVMEFSFDVLKYYFNHITGVTPTVFASDPLPLPNVYCGLITLFSVLILFFNKKISLRVKILTIIMIGAFLLFFGLSKVNFIWHAFHIPNDLPWRYSFIYVFSFVSIGFYSLSNIKSVKQLFIFIIAGLLFVTVLLAVKLNFENIDNTKAIICICLITLYLVFGILHLNKKINKFLISAMLIILASFEVIYGIDINWEINHDIKTFMSDKKPYVKLINSAKKDDNGLYRMEKTNTLTLNDGAWYDYYSMSTFSSMAYEDVSKAQRMLGLSGNNINSYYYHYQQTPVYNTMFNIKYILGEYIINSNYIPIDSEEGYNLIEYKYPSSIAYGVNKSINNMKLIAYDPFLNQSNFVRLYTNDKDVYKKVSIKEVVMGQLTYENGGTYDIRADDNSDKINIILDNDIDQNIYLYLKGDIDAYYVDNKYYSLTSDEYYTVDLGRKKAGEVNIEVSLKEEGNYITLCAYSIDESVFEEFYDKLNSNKLNVTSYSETTINGDIDVSYDNTVFTTLAYDTGWTVYVDNKPVKTKKLLDSYLGFDLKKGRHKIKLSYYPTGLKEGLITTIMSVILVFFYIIIFDKTKKNDKKIK